MLVSKFKINPFPKTFGKLTKLCYTVKAQNEDLSEIKTKERIF